ncbi:hypothetical protein L227DRAFT_566613 [Lentinus tigrinus ALCF2SS1-6]|uniref:Uncharacterized protein n=1 Tax=Lentinus tigrinus ALCF2SS1-6 TaxID=1328759 RepID=A0A5C2RWW2_9APHY|nr:hypothetical protein L227DRAFT_566613 [Lentinus tigrinus ALCF2SS1-6]
MAKDKRNGKKKATEGESAYDVLYHSRDYIGHARKRFNIDLWSYVFDAWMNRASERYLYALFGYVGVNLCNTIEPPNFPEVTIAFTPQGLLGPRKPPAGETVVQAPVTDEFGRPVRPFPEQYPDFLRALISAVESEGQVKSIHQIVDIWEIKDHNISADWNTPEAHESAWRAMTNSRTLDQVYIQAMAAFAHNPEWEKIYHTLIVGIYFSQFVFDRPQGTELDRPLSPIHVHNNMLPKARQAALDRLNDRIAQYQARTPPSIEYFNQPVLTFGLGQKASMDSPKQDVSLSPQFLYALRLPLKQYKGCKFQQSWFSPSPKKPKPVATTILDDPQEVIYKVLIENEVKTLQVYLNEYNNSPPSTAGNTTATSGGYVPSRHIQMQVEQSPLWRRLHRVIKQRIMAMKGWPATERKLMWDRMRRTMMKLTLTRIQNSTMCNILGKPAACEQAIGGVELAASSLKAGSQPLVLAPNRLQLEAE